MATNDEEWIGLENRDRARATAEDYYAIAKVLAEEERYTESLEKLREANELYPLEKYKKRLVKLEQFIAEITEQDDHDDITASRTSEPPKATVKLSGDHTELCKDFHVKTSTLKKLFSYQVEGVKWLYGLYQQQAGGILADDMGLGKTVQTIVLISSLMNMKKIKNVLIIAPKTLLINWGKEFREWAPEVNVLKFDNSVTQTRREKGLNFVQTHGGVILTTYNLGRIHNDVISTKSNGADFVWDYVILDEAHMIKNPTKTTKALYQLSSKLRLCITGTPLQNNLRELWVLYDFVSKGTLLGSYRTFKMQYETPIMRARDKNARNTEKIKGSKMAANLKEIYEPFFLRRTKAQVFSKRRSGEGVQFLSLPSKHDWVVWVTLSEVQESFYRDFLNLPEIRTWILKADNKSALVKLAVMKKICDHPRLLTKTICERIMYKENYMNINNSALEMENENDSVTIDGIEDDILIKESGKLAMCLDLLEELRRNGHKTLVFSRSTKILDIMQRILENRSWKMARLDGRVVNVQKRDEVVRTFQADASIRVMLLTSQVGGVGLTLTSADRVIIYDPSWNPAADSQAIDRSYRIGQKKEVVVYRLITCGTVEEKIYRRQIFKSSVMRQAVDFEKEPTRYFSFEELRELFTFTDCSKSDTFLQLLSMHGECEISSEYIQFHFQEMKTLTNVYNVSDHSLLFSSQEENEEIDENALRVINLEVEKAHSDLMKENSCRRQGLIAKGGFRQSLELGLDTRVNFTKKPVNHAAPESSADVIVIDHDDNEREDDLFKFNTVPELVEANLLPLPRIECRALLVGDAADDLDNPNSENPTEVIAIGEDDSRAEDHPFECNMAAESTDVEVRTVSPEQDSVVIVTDSDEDWGDVEL